jgi:hypothetical protein
MESMTYSEILWWLCGPLWQILRERCLLPASVNFRDTGPTLCRTLSGNSAVLVSRGIRPQAPQVLGCP